MPTYTVVGVFGSSASALSRKLPGRPAVLRVQVPPPSALRQTPALKPASVAAYTILGSVGSIASALTGACRSGRSLPPNSARCHDTPPSVLRQTPLPNVPAKTVRGADGSTASALTVWPRISGATTVHDAPASVDLNTPPA